MRCKECEGQLEILRKCRKILMKCNQCSKEYHLHEVADQLDRETEEALERFNAIIYD